MTTSTSAADAMRILLTFLFRRDRPVPLARAHARLAVHADRNLAKRLVTLRIGRLVAEQVLIRQLLEQIGEREMQLIDVVGEKCSPPGRLDQTLHDGLERLDLDAAALAD